MISSLRSRTLRTSPLLSLILASIHGITTGEGPAGYSEVESIGSCMDLTEGYAEYEERGERSDVTLESDRWSDGEEDPVDGGGGGTSGGSRLSDCRHDLRKRRVLSTQGSARG
ncbi:hypothetical protein P4O66_002345 [Electrophorus voltai]|uniref:Uncharacterized protein n=1 Tax=Electrophorus voltai TaxID=2609070 RepID=A0AAD9DSC8_9TELE|nr:hypothetical protein P4O66_002345 [Electrophorus voltai]